MTKAKPERADTGTTDGRTMKREARLPTYQMVVATITILLLSDRIVTM